jgi:DNA mismatch endonuclease (patch repair protein)
VVDVLTPAQRRLNMSRIRGKDTKPEMAVRRLAHSLGFRYRLHVRSLPGSPDLVFASRRKVVLVHGCFWHRHHCRYGRPTPATRARFWRNKLAQNVDRDKRARRLLKKSGWTALVIWQCQTRRTDELKDRLLRFLA